MADGELVEVHLIGLSIADYLAARQHSEELNREFALLLAQAAASPGSIPDRLLAVTRRMRTEYGDYTSSPSAQLERAIAEGRDSVNLVFHVPPRVADAATELGTLLDEADAFCAAGELLTLSTPPDALRIRHWYLSQFVRQAAGEPPVPYDEFDAPAS